MKADTFPFFATPSLPPPPPGWRRLGVAAAWDGGKLTTARIALAPVPAVAALPPLLWIGLLVRRRWVRRGRAARGECVACGYDLRGSREAGRCPECGGEVGA